jgi:FAD/FMN-containing dehydrogenase
VNTTGAATGIVGELRSICGVEHVLQPELRPRPPLIMNSVVLDPGGEPTPSLTEDAVVSPGSAEEVSAVLQLANQRQLTVAIVGNSSDLFWQRSALRTRRLSDIVLSTSRLTSVEHYDPGDLTVGVGAGCTVAHLSSMVAADGLLFAGDTPHSNSATIGGMLALGITGPLRHGYGGLRDYCIGIQFVTGDGRTGKGGGRVVKNVAGYDMMKLLIGSQGTLAVITSASFKLFPAMRKTRTFVAEFATVDETIAFRDAVLRMPLSPICLELISPRALVVQRTGVARGDSWLLCVRASGSDAVLTRYRTELGSSMNKELDGETETKWWRGVQDFPFNKDGRHEMAGRVQEFEYPLAFAISAPIAEVGAILDHLRNLQIENCQGVSVVGRVGTGQLVVSLWLSNREAPYSFLTQAINSICEKLSSHASLVLINGWHSRGRVLKTPTDRSSMRAIKNALDPNDVLNRGRFLL